jgi:hypothetical protein
MKKMIVAAVALAILAGSAWAEDTYPPPWQRSSDPNLRTTFQDWTFSTQTNPTPPDVSVSNPYGTPSATITGGTWTAVHDNHVGVWTLGVVANGYIDVVVPNAPDHRDWVKEVWTQITWAPEPEGTPTVLVDGHTGQLMETTPLPGTTGWYHSTWFTTLPYNPESETIHISGTIDVGEIVVDTRCVPEPATLSMLVLGGLGVITRRKHG